MYKVIISISVLLGIIALVVLIVFCCHWKYSRNYAPKPVKKKRTDPVQRQSTGKENILTKKKTTCVCTNIAKLKEPMTHNRMQRNSLVSFFDCHFSKNESHGAWSYWRISNVLNNGNFLIHTKKLFLIPQRDIYITIILFNKSL